MVAGFPRLRKVPSSRGYGVLGGYQAQGLILGDPTPSHTTRLSLKRKAAERMGSRPRAQAAPRVLSPRAGPQGLRRRRHRGTRFTLTEAESALTASPQRNLDKKEASQILFTPMRYFYFSFSAHVLNWELTVKDCGPPGCALASAGTAGVPWGTLPGGSGFCLPPGRERVFG